MEQPDVPVFVRDWLDSAKVGTSLEPYLIRAYERLGHDSPPYVLLEDAGAIRDRGVPAYLPFRLSVTAFGRTETEAAALYRSVTNLLHDAKNVLVAGVGFWGRLRRDRSPATQRSRQQVAGTVRDHRHLHAGQGHHVARR